MKPWIYKDSQDIEYYYHPFLDTHTMYSPDRRSRIFAPDKKGQILLRSQDEYYCDFCIGKIDQATPDKQIAVQSSSGSIDYINYPSLDNIQDYDILLRRQSNLFEILSYDYWQNKYGIQTPQQDKERINILFQHQKTQVFLENLLKLKYSKLGKKFPSLEIQKQDCEAFYSGFHDLLTSGNHYIPNASDNSQLFHSGSLSWQHHRIIFKMITNMIIDMSSRNPYITFIAIFQNWLAAAGASFEHWHKQILGLDFWGEVLTREATLYKNNPKVYQDFVLDTVIQEDLVIAENQYAIAYTEIGGKTGRIVICSKSKNLRPHEHSQNEINGMSDLTHALFGILPIHTAYNEEWLYSPLHQTEFRTPWRIVINLRTVINAGFENITQILLTPISIKEFAAILRERLQQNKNRIAPDIIIAPKNISSKTWQYTEQ
ncbi:MAG: DUF4921 family protein [Brevinema sp.]